MPDRLRNPWQTRGPSREAVSNVAQQNEATPENVAYPNQAWPENVRASGCALIAQYPVVQFGVERGDHGHALAVGH